MVKQVVAKNIFRLRKIAGMNQQDVADKAGISRPTYVAIEKGESDPRSDTLQKIAEALDVSIRELFVDIPDLKSVRFRMSKVTEQKRKIREQEIIKIAQWLNNYNYIEDALNDKKQYLLKDINVKEPKKLAQKVRNTLQIDENEPIADITEVINKAGIKLHFNSLSLDKFFGLSIGEGDGGPAISINVANNISKERQIFTIAHEMAHLILHKKSFNGSMIEDDDNEEKEANTFASYFLMPQDSFMEEVEKNSGLHWVDLVLNVKRIFKVSYRTILMRFIDEGIADKDIYQKFNVNIKRMYGISLKGHFEPDALTSYNEASAKQEPEGTMNAGMMNNRLFTLVRRALERDLISLSKAAEILDKTNDEMRELANSWEEINWSELKK